MESEAEAVDNQPANLSDGLGEIALLIEGRNLERAQSLAQQLLLQHPNSAGVHSALGDIAAARHQHREAIEWYELSLRLDQNQTVRERLARARDMLDEERFREFEEENPPRDKRPLIIGGAIAGFLLLALIVALIASSMSRRERQPTTVIGPGGRPVVRTNQPAEPGKSAAPAGVASRPGTRPGAAGPSGVGAGSAVAPAGPETPAGGLRVTQSVDAPMADRDVLLTRSLAAMTWGNGEALGWRVMALMDPFTGYVLISLEVPPGMRGQDLFPPVIDMAYKLAVAAINADRGIDSLTVRVITPLQDDKGRTMELVAFRGNTTREALDYYLKRGVTPDQQTIWSHVFATTWWNPSVPAGSAAAEGSTGAPAAGGGG